MKTKDFGFVGLLIIVLFSVLMSWLVSTAPSNEPTRIQITKAFPCTSIGNEFYKAELFAVDQNIYICSNISANTPEFQKQVQIRVYEKEHTSFEYPIHYENLWITSKNIQIPINAYFEPGSYTIEISDGRIVLTAIQVEIINK